MVLLVLAPRGVFFSLEPLLYSPLVVRFGSRKSLLRECGRHRSRPFPCWSRPVPLRSRERLNEKYFVNPQSVRNLWISLSANGKYTNRLRLGMA